MELTQLTDGSYSVTVTVNQDQTELVIPSSVVGGTGPSIRSREWKKSHGNRKK